MSDAFLDSDTAGDTVVDGLLDDTSRRNSNGKKPGIDRDGGGDSDSVSRAEQEEGLEDDWGQHSTELYVINDTTGDVEDYERGDELFFHDKKRRIDYILAWPSAQKDEAKSKDAEEARKVFESNLIKEGLNIEPDIQTDRAVQYIKVHAPWEVLTRYAELMHLHMPIKEKLETQPSLSLWERMRTYTACLMRPFQPDPETLPEVDKKFTHVFERGKEYLFAIPQNKDKFFSHAARSMIVDYILRRKRFNEENTRSFEFVNETNKERNHGDENEKEAMNGNIAFFQKTGIKSLLAKGIYSAAYPLHEGSYKSYSRASMRRLLYEQWAHWSNFYKLQPLDHIRVYFGEKVAMYFAWLGYYTYFLLPASIVGLFVFIYGLVTVSNDIVSESCDWNNNFTMCPKCDRWCPYWNYAIICNEVRASHMFDNGATVFFAVFISLWGTFFLEFWKREQSAIQFRWNLMSFQEEEEPPRPEFLASLSRSKFRRVHNVSGVNEPYMPFWRRRVPVYITSVSIMLFLVAMAIMVVIGIIVYRMSVLGAMYLQDDERFYKQASLVATATAACINLVLIFILNWASHFVGLKLTDWECLRTQTEYDSSLTFKLYVLQFVNFYSSLFYIAFFKGRFAGSPGRYNRFFGARQEECVGGGCLMELCIQLSIIFVGKQIMNSVVEVFMPRLMKMAKICFANKDNPSKKHYAVWEKDYLLVELGPRGMFSEYLEMLLQFGFVTIFVAAFPLAPLCALINNVIEIRIDANKFVTQLRRPMAARTQTIGVWYNVLFGLSRLAVLTNALIIAVTSTFIDRLVYVTGYSEDGTLKGFVNDSLAYFDVANFTSEHRPIDYEGRFKDVLICRYPDYREPPWSAHKYMYSAKFWHILAAQFMFVVIFENVVVLLASLIAFLIPDMPRKLSEQARQEAYLTNELILRTELEIAQNRQMSQDALRHINYAATPTVVEHGDETTYV